MKKKITPLLFAALVSSIIFISSNQASASHPLPLVNVSQTIGCLGVTVDASSDPSTCANNQYWIDVEVQDIALPFLATLANPVGCFTPSGNNWVSLTGPMCYTSADIMKPTCVLTPYPSVFIPFSALLPGTVYKWRARERLNSTTTYGDWSATFTFTTPAVTTPAVIITASGVTTFCQGGNVTLTSSSGTSYLWSNNATTQSVVISASGNYSVTVTDVNGCSATSSGINVTVNPLPSIPIITASGATTFCQGNNVTLTSSSGTSYLWSNNATTQSVVILASGNYSVTVTNVNGCSATSSGINVTVNPLPNISAGNNITICRGGTTTLTATGGISYVWNPGGQTTASILVSPTLTSSYTVTGTNANGCSNSNAVTVTVDLCTGIQPILTDAAISIFPNPTSGVFTIQSSEKISAIEIINLLGEKIYQLSTFNFQLSTNIDLSKERKGIYFIKLISEKGTATKKLIIQ